MKKHYCCWCNKDEKSSTGYPERERFYIDGIRCPCLRKHMEDPSPENLWKCFQGMYMQKNIEDCWEMFIKHFPELTQKEIFEIQIPHLTKSQFQSINLKNLKKQLQHTN